MTLKDILIAGKLTISEGGGGGGISVDDIAQNLAPSGDITLSTATKIKSNAFRAKPITSITAPNVTSVESDALNGTSIEAITDANFPSVTSNASCFNNMTALKSLKLTRWTNLSSGFAAIKGDTNLLTFEAPANTNGTGNQFAYGNTKMTLCDIGSCTSIAGSSFYNCSALKTLIIRRSDAICALSNAGAFTGSSFKSGGTGGTIYIPKALYDHLGDGTSLDYKAANNWSTVNGYGTITWAQIEGSPYEL